MPRNVKAGLIQASNDWSIEDHSIAEIKKNMIDKHVGMIEAAGKAGVQVLCLQEIFCGPYFCAEQDIRWFESAEPIPDGPTIVLMQRNRRSSARSSRTSSPSRGSPRRTGRPTTTWPAGAPPRAASSSLPTSPVRTPREAPAQR